eukprot:scaffold56096_cov39-Prasinocladus_malaysianus.AAC.1
MGILSGHEHSMRLHDSFLDDQACVLVTDVMEGGDLMEAMAAGKKIFSEAESRTTMRGLLKFLVHSHSLGIYHRDIKLENIVFQRRGDLSSVRVADFGLSKQVSSPEDRLHVLSGTPMYLAPECCV